MSEPSDLLPAQQPHTFAEDIAGLLTGVVLVSLGLLLLVTASAVTGGTAGLSLLLHYATGWDFSWLFVLVNLPFYLLAIRVKGWRFTVRSLLAVVGVSLLSAVLPSLVTVATPAPWFAILVGNLLVGTGILVLFRHHSSVGGFSILALVAQERAGMRAGYVQLGLDLLVILASFAVVAPPVVLLSAAGAVVLNLVLAMNHKPGRYLGY